MRILSIISSGYVQGGAEQSVASYNTALRAMGHDVRTISSNAHPEVAHFSDYEFEAIPSHGIKSIAYALFNPSAYKVTKQVLKSFNPDVVLLNTMQQVTPSVLLALKHYPTIQCVHGPEAFTTSLLAWHMDRASFKNGDYDLRHLTPGGKLRYFLLRHIYVPAYKRGFRHINRFLVFSSYTRKMLIKDGYTMKPISSVPIGITLRQPSSDIQRSPNAIAYVGRLEKFKGVMDLIDAMPTVLAAIPSAQLGLAGDGTYLPELKVRVQQLGIGKSVTFLGHLSQTSVAGLFARAEVVVVPSTWPETFGKVGIEAMGLGTPVIATDVGGVRDWLHNEEDGLLVKPGNPAALADAIIRMLSDHELRQAMGKAARESADDFTTERFAQSLLRVIQGVVV